MVSPSPRDRSNMLNLCQACSNPAPSFASRSALSFPWTLVCPGTHIAFPFPWCCQTVFRGFRRTPVGGDAQGRSRGCAIPRRRRSREFRRLFSNHYLEYQMAVSRKHQERWHTYLREEVGAGATNNNRHRSQEPLPYNTISGKSFPSQAEPIEEFGNSGPTLSRPWIPQCQRRMELNDMVWEYESESSSGTLVLES